MKGDFTRDTFDATKHFSRVLMQQGRVQLDADFNEQVSILLHYIQTLAADLVNTGVLKNKEGFGIERIVTGGKDDFSISIGHYYVDGILCENENASLTYRTQPGFTDMPELNASNTYQVYLDVWEGHILPQQDASIRESALGGPDTCTRAKVMWRVKVYEGDTTLAIVEKLRALKVGSLKARVKPSDAATDVCSLPAESSYRGRENQLYRVEVHQGNVNENDGSIDSSKSPTFKWSRDNGSIVFPIRFSRGGTSSDYVYAVEHLGRDARCGLKPGQWVEIVDDVTEAQCLPGVMALVKAVDTVEMVVTLSQPYTDTPKWLAYSHDQDLHPMLRRWDQQEKGDITLEAGAMPLFVKLVTNDTNNPKWKKEWKDLESGIQVEFSLNSASEESASKLPAYRSGDYWLIPARLATGDIEWPRDNKEPLSKNSLIQHHYAPLGKIKNGAVQ